MSDNFKKNSLERKDEDKSEQAVLEKVKLPAVLSSTVVRSVIQLNTVQEVEDKVKEFSCKLQTQEMYKVSSNMAAKTVTLEYRCGGWPSDIILTQFSQMGESFKKVTYLPHYSLVNKAIAEDMKKKKDIQDNVWFDVRIRAIDTSNVLEKADSIQPEATKECVFEIKYTTRFAHIKTTVNNRSTYLDSKFKPISVVELTKERIVFDQVASISSVVDAVLHLTEMDGKDTYSNSNVTFDIDPNKFRWSEIPLNFMFYYDIQTRIHSPSTLRVFFVRRDLKNDKVVTSSAGRVTV